MFNLDDCIGFVTLRSGKVLSDTLEKDLAPFNITRAQWIAMYYIYNGDNITQRELADKLAVKQPTVVRLLQTLEIKGYLLRTDNHTDKRKKQLELSEDGSTSYLNSLPTVEAFKSKTTAGISVEDLETMKKVLEIMTQNNLNGSCD